MWWEQRRTHHLLVTTMAHNNNKAALFKHREKNGYGITTSRWSVTSIGMEGSDKSAAYDAIIRQDGQRAKQKLKTVHPKRSELYAQSSYPETVKRLQVCCAALRLASQCADDSVG